MTSRQHKQAAHQRQKQKKATKRARKQKRTDVRAKRRLTALVDPRQPRCGLCGATTNLTKTECCDQWICDDEDQYVLFSYAHNSCHRNHRRHTVCGHHFEEGHSGRWQDCAQCRRDTNTEMYVFHATNEYNFEVLENPPKYKPTRCAKCGKVIVLSQGGYSICGDRYECGECTQIELPDFTS